jgi:tetratricopeptide (TPR) repeat protein
VLLAIVFAASFVLFGVGTGFGGLQDIILQERQVGGGPSESDAREAVRERPNDPQGYRDLATALQNTGDADASIEPLAKYVSLRPADIDAQRELAGLYLRRADTFRNQAIDAQVALQLEVPGSTFRPQSTSKIGEGLGSDPITDALSAKHNAALNEAFTKMGSSYAQAVVAYKAVAKAQPRDPAVQFELAQTAEAANDLPTALAAYKAFLRLAPEDQSAAAVKQRVAELEAQVAPSSSG